VKYYTVAGAPKTELLNSLRAASKLLNLKFVKVGSEEHRAVYDRQMLSSHVID
jgi:hypothetical protein